MKQRILYLSLLLVFGRGTKVWAYQPPSGISQIDSLEHLLTQTEEDKFDLWNRLSGLCFKYGQFEKGAQYSMNMLKHAKREKDTTRLAALHYRLSLLHGEMGNWKVAIAYTDTALALVPPSNTALRFRLHNVMGQHSLRASQFEDGEWHFRKSLDIAIFMKDTMGIKAGYNNLGIVFKKNYAYDSALHYYRLAANLTQDSLKLATNITNIGKVYRHLEQWDSAMHYEWMAYHIRIRHGDSTRSISNIQELAEIKMLLEDWEAAVDLSREAIASAERYLVFDLIMESLTVLQRALFMQQNFEEANQLDSVILVWKNFEDEKLYVEQVATTSAKFGLKLTEEKLADIQNSHKTASSLITCLVVLVVLGIVVTFWLVKTREKKLSLYTQKLDKLSEENQVLKQNQIKQASAQVLAQAHQRLQALNEKSNRLSTAEKFQEVRALVLMVSPEFLARLKALYPKVSLNKNHLHFLFVTRLNAIMKLSNKEVFWLLLTSKKGMGEDDVKMVNSVSQLRRRIEKKGIDLQAVLKL
ncbi:MAG: hypothetical protein AAFQ98_14365 [Bacteroidota bacterium]